MNTIEHHIHRESAVHILLEDDACSASTQPVPSWRKSQITENRDHLSFSTILPFTQVKVFAPNPLCENRDVEGPCRLKSPQLDGGVEVLCFVVNVDTEAWSLSFSCSP